jgi:hypothetical protein
MNDTQQRLTPELVVMAIQGGMLDASLDALKDVVNLRREVLDVQAANALRKDDTFLIKDCSPKKWNGQQVRFTGERDGIWLVCVTTSGGRQIRLRKSHVGTIMSRGGQ